MEKLIIENRTNLKMINLLPYVKYVIEQGKVSETSKGKQYCFVTTFKEGIIIYADKNKKSDKIIITKTKRL